MFLSANLIKLPDGGYVPVLMAIASCILIWTWVRGTAHVQTQGA